MYVVLEGIDTCGKSTQIKQLKEVFPNAIFTKEPGGSEIGAKIREIILNAKHLSDQAEFFLFLADRAEHFNSIIKPNISRLIIADRSLISGIAYTKINNAREMNLECAGGILPDLCVVLRLEKEELERRLGNKSNDCIEARGISYLLSIQENIINIAPTIAKQTLVLDAADERESITRNIANVINTMVKDFGQRL